MNGQKTQVLMLDVSVLGTAYHEQRARTGIYRVVEELAVNAARLSGWQVYFCALQRNLLQCRRYLDANRDRIPPDGYELIGPSGAALQLERAIDRCTRGIVQPGKGRLRKLFWRVCRKLFRLLGSMASVVFRRSWATVPAEYLVPGAVLHAAFAPVPSEIRRSPGVRIVQQVYDLIPVLHPEWFAFNEMGIIGEMIAGLTERDWTVSISDATGRDLLRLAPQLQAGRARTVHLAAGELFHAVTDAQELQRVRNRCGIPAASRYILSLATLEPRKNMKLLVEAFVQLVAEDRAGEDTVLVLTGGEGWSFEGLLETIAGSGAVAERIIRTGFVADEDLAALYSGAEVFVYPSLYEGFGLPPLEAMQCGTAVIVSNTSSLPEVTGDAALYIDPLDRDGLAAGLCRVLEEAGLREELCRKSLLRAARFSWERFGREITAVYQAAAAD